MITEDLTCAFKVMGSNRSYQSKVRWWNWNKGSWFLFSVVPTARAIAYSEPSCCSDGFQAGKLSNDVEERRTAIGTDHVRRTVLVEVRCCGPSPPFLSYNFHLILCEISQNSVTCSLSTSLCLQSEGLPREYTYSVFFCPNGQYRSIDFISFLEVFKNEDSQ